MMALLNVPPAWRLADLLAGTSDLDLGQAAGLGVSDLALDSRRVVPGSLFLACDGPAGHGMVYAEHARDRGALGIAAEPTAAWDHATLAQAAARLRLPVIPVTGLTDQASALADRFYRAPSAHLDVIGIAGSVGKTSVGHLLAQTLAAETRCAVIGTLGVGLPGGLSPAVDLNAVTVQDTLARLRAWGAQAVAMSVPTQGRGHTAAVRFSHAVLTHLSGSDDDATLAALFHTPGLRWAVLNAEDPRAAGLLAGLAPGVCVALYGRGDHPPVGLRHDLWLGLRDLTPLRRGLRLNVIAQGPRGSEGRALEVGVLGAANAANLMAVLAVLLSRNFSLGAAAHALAKVQGVPGRMEGFGGEDAPLVAVDFAHTPDALARAMDNLGRHRGGRLITVFGCGGRRDPGKRPLMGAVAEAGSDLVILTDDNPRGEDGDAIIADILAGMSHPGRVRVERRRGLAIRIALTLAGIGDSVLIAGKGHETTQDMGELKVRYSDRGQVMQALREWTEGRR